jgi:hypothetical protein
MRVDVAYSFRAGRTTSSLSAADVYRAEGDLSLQILNSSGVAAGDSLVAMGTQNLLFASLNRAVPIGSTVYLRPVFDFRYQSLSTLAGGVDLGGNWVAGAGFDLPYASWPSTCSKTQGERGQVESGGRYCSGADWTRGLRHRTLPITTPTRTVVELATRPALSRARRFVSRMTGS